MNTKYLLLDKHAPELEKLSEAADIIRGGGLVAFPTETVYGLGADATNPLASDKIYKAKGRPSNNPLIVHISNIEDAENYVRTDDRYYKIAEAFMPGPITVIMPSIGTVADCVSAGLDTLAIRCPAHPVARELIRRSGRPIAAPSANTSGRPSPTSAQHVRHDLDGKVDMIIDGGECEVGLESTIIKLTDDKCILLRPGGITYEMLTEVLGYVELGRGVIEKPDQGMKIESPGMLIAHYAPKAPLYLVRGKKDAVVSFLTRQSKKEGHFVLCYDGIIDRSDNVISLGREHQYSDAARLLFSSLRRADDLSAKIIYAPYPEQSGIGLALLNRMLRASAFKVIDV